MLRFNSTLWFTCLVVSSTGCWVHAEPDVPHAEVRHEVVVHPEGGDGHHDDDHHHHHDHDHDHD